MSTSIWYIGGSKDNYTNRVNYAGFKNSILKARSNAIFTYIDGQSTYLSDIIINQINSNADLLVIAEGGFIKIDNDNMLFNINEENVNNISVPVVSTCITDYYDLDIHGFEGLDVLLNKSSVASVLLYDSLDSLTLEGINNDNVYVAPQYFIVAPGDNVVSEIFNSNVLRIGISLDNIESLKFRQLINSIANRLTAKVYIIESTYDIDNSVNSKKNILKESLPSGTWSIIKDDMYNELFPPSDAGSPLYVGIYKNMDIVFGSSLISASICIGNDIPFVGVGDNEYLNAFLIDAGIDKCIRINDADKSIDDLIDRCDFIDDIRDKCLAAKEKLIYSLDSFTNKILA